MGSVTISSEISTILQNGFRYCLSLETIAITSKVTTINVKAFTNSGLLNIEIPATVTKNEGYAFSDCENLETVIYPHDGEETVANNIFS